jgi:hypothetical protein
LGRIDESKSGQSRLIAKSNGPPEEKTVEGKPPEAAQPPVESKPAEATENSAASTVTRPLARDVYDWASRLTAEAGGSEEYYWTPEIERLVTKLKMTKRALIGVVGVQGVGKTATMRAIQAELVRRGFDHDRVIATKVPENGGLTTALKTAFNPRDADYSRLEDLLGQVMADRLFHDSILQRRVHSRANHVSDTELAEEVEKINATFDETDVMKLRTLIPERIVRELEAEALGRLLESQKVIMIDMPDYPKHDRRLIAHDLDDVQVLWNRLMMHPDVTSDASIVVFIQKETFNHADHFFYGKMEITDLAPLTTVQLMGAYTRKWKGSAPFTEEALQYVAKMSRGIFRRFKRYIALALETRITDQTRADASNAPDAPVDIELVKRSVTDEEVIRDMDKELDGIFKKRELKEKALDLIKVLSEIKIKKERLHASGGHDLAEVIAYDVPPPDGLTQSKLAEKLDLNEMAVSRLVRELEQHGFVKRTTWRSKGVAGEWKYVEMNW